MLVGVWVRLTRYRLEQRQDIEARVTQARIAERIPGIKSKNKTPKR
jgi:hypothetical protein